MKKLLLVLIILLLSTGAAFCATEAEVKALETKAKDGDAAAMVQLGDAYFEESLKFYKNAADRGYAPAQYVMGRMYANEYDTWMEHRRYGEVKVNYALARGYYTKAAEQGHADAQRALARLALKHDPYEPTAADRAEAAKWYDLAVADGYVKNADETLAQWLDMLGKSENDVAASADAHAKSEGVVTKTIVVPPNVAELKAKARNNNPEALYNLAEYYSDEGLKWYSRAAAQNNALAQRKLAILYNGEGLISPYLKNPWDWFKKAAENGDVVAQRVLGDFYGDSHGSEYDALAAIKWYTLAAEQGDAEAQVQLWFWLAKYQSDKYKSDPEQGLKWLTAAAEQGYPRAMDLLGQYYAERQNYDEASKWFEKLNQSDDPYYLYQLADKYFVGKDGVKQDYRQSYTLLMRIAKITGGLSSTDFLLSDYYYLVGMSYYKGYGTGTYYSEALRWFTRAAELGSAPAAYEAGQIYKNGQGVRRNAETALEWFAKAYELGDRSVAYTLGRIYADGDGRPKDDAKAVEWFTIAAGHGNVEAMEWFLQNPDKPDLPTILFLEEFFVEKRDMQEQRTMAERLLGNAAAAGNLDAALYMFSLAGAGDVKARYGTAQLYYAGKGFTQDNVEAWAWGRLALDKCPQTSGSMYNEIEEFIKTVDAVMPDREQSSARERWRVLSERYDRN